MITLFRRWLARRRAARHMREVRAMQRATAHWTQADWDAIPRSEQTVNGFKSLI